MSTNQVPGPSSTIRQRILVLITVVAVIMALRERAFAQNRSRFGPVAAPAQRS